MKKSLIVATLAVLLSVNVLTPLTYALENGAELGVTPENVGENLDNSPVDPVDDNTPSWYEGEGSDQWDAQDSQNGWENLDIPQNSDWDDGEEWGETPENNLDNSEEWDELPENGLDAQPVAAPMPAMAPMSPLTAPAPIQSVTLVDGPTFNTIIESLAGDLSNITAIKKWTQENMPATAVDISENGDESIKAWYDNDTIYYYTQATTIKLNSDSSSMFKNCSNLTDISVLSTWNTSNVTSLYDFFNGCSSLTDVSAVENWDVSSVSDMRSIFYGIWATTIDLSNWNTSSATQMNNMFQACSNLTDIDLSDWNTSNVTNMRYMFAQTPKLSELNLWSFDTSNVTDMVGMFFIPSGTTPSLTTIYVSDKFVINSAADTDMMFKRQKNLVWQDGYKCSGNCEWSDTNGNAYIDNEYTPWYFTVAPDMVSVVLNYDPNTPGSLVEVKTIAKWGSISEPVISDKDGYTTLWWYDLDTDQEFTSWNVINKNVTLYAKYQASVDYATFVAGSTFKNRLASLAANASNVKKIVRADKLNSNATQKLSTDDSVPVRAWYENGTVYYYSEVEKIYLNANSSQMFQNFTNLVSIDMSGWDTSKVERVQGLFDTCSSLVELDLSSWNTSKVITMHSLFKDCASLKTIKWIENFDTKNVTDMYWVFLNCNSLKELDLSWRDTSKVTKMKQMFGWQSAHDGKSQLTTIYVSDLFVVSSVTDDEWMFLRARKLVWWDWTVWNSSYVTKTRARIDNLPWQPWYFTDRSLYAKVTFMDEWKEITSQLTKKWTLLTEPTLQERLNKKVTWYKDAWLTNSLDIDNDDIESDITLYAKWICIDEAIEKNWVCVLKAAEDQRQQSAWLLKDLELYFVDDTAPEKALHYTIADRNLWSNEVWTGESAYGYYYQWWNNYGFSREDSENRRIATDYNHVAEEIWKEWMPSKYASDVFIVSDKITDGAWNSYYPTWQELDSSLLRWNNLWWGAGDSETSNGNWSKKDRQWPCPDGYYVPSAYDWNSVLLWWKSSVYDPDEYKIYWDHLLLPIAWDLWAVDSYVDNDGDGLYWTSSPANGMHTSYRMMFRGQDDAFRIRIWNYSRSWWEPVRCFKNNFKNEWVEHKLNVYANGWVKAVVTTSQDKIITLQTPTHPEWRMFGWWYTTPNFLRGTRVEVWSGVENATGLWARWLPDEESYIVTFVNEDGTELQKVEVALWTMPTYSGTPTKASDKNYTYTFDKWEPEIVPVTWDATYTAVYTAKKKWSKWSGGWKWWDSDPEPTHGSASRTNSRFSWWWKTRWRHSTAWRQWGRRCSCLGI